MSNLNPMCDGTHCVSSTAQVRLYTLGGGGNLILCKACWVHENRYRQQRGNETGAPENWPLNNWDKAVTYEGAK